MSVKTRVAVPAPEVVEAKRTSAVHAADAGSEPGQLFIWLKKVGFEPPSLMEEMVSGAVPVLVRVMVCAGL